MRSLAGSAGLLLLVFVGGCGDDSGTPPDGPMPDARMVDAAVDAPPGPDRGVTVVRHLGVLDAGAEDDGGFFDFTGDTIPDNSLAVLSIINSFIQNSICPNTGPCAADGLRLLGRLDSLDDPVNDADVSVALFHAFDFDTDPNDDFNGMGAFLIDPASLDSQGNPISTLMTGHIAGGTLYASAAGELTLQFGVVTFKFVHGRIRAHVALQGNATHLTNGIIGGVIPACTAKNIQLPAPINQSLLDFITNCSRNASGGCDNAQVVQPDVDLNGNGTLETFTNDNGLVTACTDGNLGTVTATTCPCDPVFSGGDGFSAVEFFDSLPARIAGVAPPPDAGAP